MDKYIQKFEEFNIIQNEFTDFVSNQINQVIDYELLDKYFTLTFHDNHICSFITSGKPDNTYTAGYDGPDMTCSKYKSFYFYFVNSELQGGYPTAVDILRKTLQNIAGCPPEFVIMGDFEFDIPFKNKKFFFNVSSNEEYTNDCTLRVSVIPVDQ